MTIMRMEVPLTYSEELAHRYQQRLLDLYCELRESRDLELPFHLAEMEMELHHSFGGSAQPLPEELVIQ